MDINIILGIMLLLVMIYFLALVISLRRRNQQAGKAPAWNNFRYHLFTQAREDQVKAHRIARSLKGKYSDLGAPYADDRDQAMAVLGAISDNTRKVMEDQNRRPPISLEPEPYSWKTFMIAPLLAEYRARQTWWQTTQELGARLSRNPSGFSGVEKLEKRLAAKGEDTRAALDTLKTEAENLIQDFQAEARTPAQFKGQIQELEGLSQEIDQTVGIFLSESEFSPKQVAAAAAKLDGFKGVLEKLNQTLNISKNIRQDTRSQLQKNQAVIDSIAVLLKTEAQAGRPIQYFREALDAEIEIKNEQERQREDGQYLKTPAQEQFQRLRTLERNIEVLIQERARLGERLTRGENEINRTEAWINSIQAPYLIDQTAIILEEVQKQQSVLYQLLQSSEDLDLLSSQIFIDPGKLANNRAVFDQRVKDYQSLYQKLQTEIPDLIERLRFAIQNLRLLNPHYHMDLDLDELIVQMHALEEDWAAAVDPPQIRESQIDRLIDELRQFERTLQKLDSAYQKVERGYQASVSDRQDARQIIEDQAFTELHQVMQLIAREDQLSLSDPAGEYARQAETLNQAVERIDTDFAGVTDAAARLLADMKSIWHSYQKKYAEEMKKYKTLVEDLKDLQTGLEKFKRHDLLDFHSRVSSPLATIADWFQAVPPQSIQGLVVLNDEGYLRQVEIEKTVKELRKEDRKYTWAKDEAMAVIEVARAAIMDAEKELTKIPWGTQKTAAKPASSKSRSPALEHSYRYLDAAEAAYQEITDPAVEYHNSVDKAVSDLAKRVQANADHARDDAKAVRRELREQIDDIDQKRADLEKALADGQGYALRLEDTGFRSQWSHIYRKYSQFDLELENHDSYREAFSYLEQALIETRYQIERMREFEDTR